MRAVLVDAVTHRNLNVHKSRQVAGSKHVRFIATEVPTLLPETETTIKKGKTANVSDNI